MGSNPIPSATFLKNKEKLALRVAARGDLAEVRSEPLSAHIAAKIAVLTREAGRLQALATERAEESARLATAQRDLLNAGSGQLSAEDAADLTVRKAQMANAIQRLQSLKEVSEEGARLMAATAQAREALLLSRRRDELSNSLLPEIEALVRSITQRSASSFVAMDEALQETGRVVDIRVAEAERLVAIRIRALSELDMRVQDLAKLDTLKAARDRLSKRLDTVDKAVKKVDQCRKRAKRISECANKVRSRIVKAVFNTSLNTTWRDLFVVWRHPNISCRLSSCRTAKGGRSKRCLRPCTVRARRQVRPARC